MVFPSELFPRFLDGKPLFQGVLSNAAANGKRLRAMAASMARKAGILDAKLA
jgi:hypothetical protein